MADIVDLKFLSVVEVENISQGTNSDDALCLKVDLEGVDFNELIEQLVGQYGYEDLLERIQEKYS